MPPTDYILSKFNISEPIQTGPPILDKHYKPYNIGGFPRRNLRLYERPFNPDDREPWSLPISLFAKYEDDNEEVENKCFEEDWKNLNMPSNIDADEK